MAEQTPKGAQRLHTATELAFDRTRAAYERTMMAWIRTAASLITFGFSIYKFFQIEAPGRDQQNRLIGPREFAFMLVSIGLVHCCWQPLNTARTCGNSERDTPAGSAH
jgi:inner membrane protein YidH